MSIESKLDQLWANSPIIEIDDLFKGLFVSDLHTGVKDQADDFQKNETIFLRVVPDYKKRGFKIFGLGDLKDLWENSNLAKILETYPWLRYIFDEEIVGNHDQKLILPQSYILFNKKSGKKILLVHGHQGDFFNDEAYPLGWFFTKYIWRNLQMIGFKDPTTAQKGKNPKKHELTRMAFHDWACSRKQTVIFGHTHFAESDPPYYWNCGTWVGDGGQAVEIVDDRISLKTFGAKGGIV
jgi:UDP-2,3-diacylglucosamine pyrophosphatase LpxH